MHKFRLLVALMSFVLMISGVSAETIRLTEDFESPSTPTAYSQGTLTDNGNWIGATSGYRANYHGITDKAGGDFAATDPNHQAYAFRYSSNAGITSAQNKIGSLTDGVTYTVTFDVVEDGGRADANDADYNVYLMVFNIAEARTSMSSGGTVLRQVTGTGPTDGSFQTVSFTYTADAVADATEIGKDIAVRFRGDFDTAIIDNIEVKDDTTGDVSPPSLLGFSPSDNTSSIAVDRNLVATFNETITEGTGNIEIRRTSDDVSVHTLDVNGANVSLSGDELTINPPLDLQEGVSYYVLIDNTAIEDSAGNVFAGISSKTLWNFTTILPNGPRILYTGSFESPVVSGLQQTAPAGWVRSTAGFGAGRCGLYNENTGNFTTPYGAQGAATWYNSAALTTEESTLDAVLTEDVTTTVRFSVANASGLSGAFKVELVAFIPGDSRLDDDDGSELASVSGTATQSDMSEEYAFSFTPGSGHADLGKLLAIQIEGNGSLVDNVVLSDSFQSSGLIFTIK